MSRTLIVLAFAAVLIVAKADSSHAQERVSLGGLIEEALNNNPGIKRAYQEWKAAEYMTKQAGSLPDPMASYTYFGENVETRVGPQEHKYGLSQKIPFPGKLGLKKKAQSKQSAILQEKYEAARRNVMKDVKLVYYDIFWVDKAIRITEEEKSILESLEKVARRRYESNLAPQQDVIKAQVEMSKLIDKLFLLRQNRNSLVARLNSILNRPAGQEIGTVGDPSDTAFSYTLDDLRAFAIQSNQQLLAAQLDVEKAEYEASLAGLEYLPDFTFGVDYIQVGGGHTTAPNDGQDAWMGMIAVNIPLWFDKLSARRDEKKALLDARKEDHQGVQNSVAFDVEDLYFRTMVYKDELSLYKTALIPQTEQAFQAAQAGYEAGEVDFLNWLDAERVSLQTRLAYYKAVAEYQKSIAYLERAVGKDL